MAKCPECNHEVSFFSQRWLNPFLASRDALGTAVFTCRNCKKELKVTTISNVFFIMILIASVIIIGITLKMAIFVLGAVFLECWIGWRYIIKLRVKNDRDNFKSFRLS